MLAAQAGDVRADAPTREQGWRRFLPALLLFMLVPVLPLVPLLAPIRETILLLVCGMAAHSLVAWRSGGRVLLAVAWVALSIWMLRSFSGGDAAYAAVARGWVLLLAASFGALSLYRPEQSFLPRALASVALAGVMAVTVVLGRDGGSARFAAALSDDVDRRSAAALAEWNRATSTPEWKEVEESNQSAIDLAEQVRQIYVDVPQFTRGVVPALLALESLIGLAVVWGLFHRVSRTRIGPPLMRLRELRFNDQLVWGLVLGAVFAVLPSLGALRGVGYNLLLFFGALYALRGLGVLLWFLRLRGFAFGLFFFMALLLWPLMGVFALGIGLGDTWLDWRGRAARQNT